MNQKNVSIPNRYAKNWENGKKRKKVEVFQSLIGMLKT
ncbi:hypothetical protein THA_1256 [Thermosipho africanus TCF52B]|uniref:Uncharacterized protein n=1 Tax=Thermosipho africanus (strain TCF52B) TaxID=484019 RepID=B7IHY7_THEAB|nr:hypothetical protein THA_1256 [Thermosipho africanus TCF52B]